MCFLGLAAGLDGGARLFTGLPARFKNQRMHDKGFIQNGTWKFVMLLEEGHELVLFFKHLCTKQWLSER